MKLSVVVPCYNEEDNIDKLKAEFFPVIEKLLGNTVDGGQIDSIEVIFVDDTLSQSAGRTSEEAKKIALAAGEQCKVTLAACQ